MAKYDFTIRLDAYLYFELNCTVFFDEAQGKKVLSHEYGATRRVL